MKIRLDRLGRVVLPKPLRLRYGLQPGTELEITEDVQAFTLSPARSQPVFVQEDGIWVHHGTPEGSLDFSHAVGHDREERLKKVGGTE